MKRAAVSKKANIYISFSIDGNAHVSEASDRVYRDRFEALCRTTGEIRGSESMGWSCLPSGIAVEDACPAIRSRWPQDVTVTIVLIGNDAWRRRSVDWDIAASLGQPYGHSSCGLIGIVLPSFQGKRYPLIPHDYCYLENQSKAGVSRRALPERFVRNLENGFARLYEWSDDLSVVGEWIDEALSRCDRITPDNTLPLFRRDR